MLCFTCCVRSIIYYYARYYYYINIPPSFSVILNCLNPRVSLFFLFTPPSHCRSERMSVGCSVACQVKPQQHHPSCSSLVLKKEGFIILRYKYTSLSVQSIHRNWCCNLKPTEFTFPVRTYSVQLAAHTRVMFTVYFIACLMHKGQV